MRPLNDCLEWTRYVYLAGVMDAVCSFVGDCCGGIVLQASCLYSKAQNIINATFSLFLLMNSFKFYNSLAVVSVLVAFCNQYVEVKMLAGTSVCTLLSTSSV